MILFLSFFFKNVLFLFLILPVCGVMVGAGVGRNGMLPSEGVRRCPTTVCARGRMAPSDGVRRCPRFSAIAAETWVGVRD